MKNGTITQAFMTANANRAAARQELAQTQAKLISTLFTRTVVLAGVAVLTYFCGPKVGLGALAVMYFLA